MKGKNSQDLLKDIQERYNEIIEGLGLTLSLEKEFEIIRDNLQKSRQRLRCFTWRIFEWDYHGKLSWI